MRKVQPKRFNFSVLMVFEFSLDVWCYNQYPIAHQSSSAIFKLITW